MLQFGILTSRSVRSSDEATSTLRIGRSPLAYWKWAIAQQKKRFCGSRKLVTAFIPQMELPRMTFRHRMPDVDEAALRLMRQSYRSDAALIVQDRAASTCLTSTEWAERLLSAFPRTEFEASDTLLYLFRISLPEWPNLHCGAQRPTTAVH